jgi:hypothetical protein
MTRQALIEQILRNVYGEQPTQDSDITPNLVNIYINQGIGVAVKQNYKDSVQFDGIGYVNNSFYTTFKGLGISQNENFLWEITLPQVPLAIGTNEGVSNLRFKSADGKVSIDAIPLSINQKAYAQSMRAIPNKVLYYIEGNNAYILTAILLSEYTSSVTLISGGDSTNLNSVLNVPDDYIPVIMNYVIQLLMAERKAIKDIANDGSDN